MLRFYNFTFVRRKKNVLLIFILYVTLLRLMYFHIVEFGFQILRN